MTAADAAQVCRSHADKEYVFSIRKSDFINWNT